MKIDHVGIVVRSISGGIKYWNEVFGYEQITEVVENTRQKVNVVFLSKEGSQDIKLIEPTDETSPIYALSKRGGGLHHLCFKCEDMNNEIDRLSGMGLRVITKPEPGEAFDNENIAFLFAGNGLNIELIDTDKKAKLLKDSK